MTNPAKDLSPLFKVYLLGTFTLYQADKPVSLPVTPAAQSLLAYLLLHRDRSHSRARLAGSFWPEMSESDARRAVGKALSTVRQILSPAILNMDTHSVHIPAAASLWVDVVAFKDLADQHLPARPAAGVTAWQGLYAARQLYQGDLLEGLYDDWILLEQDRLREMYLQVLEQLIVLEKTAGHYGQALNLALELSQADPLREATHRELMRLYFALNRPQAALKQFESCRQILKNTLGLEPEAKTMALAAEISCRDSYQIGEHAPRFLPKIMTAPPPVAAPERELPLVGRAAERAHLLQLVEGMLHQRQEGYAVEKGIILVEGEAGVGKTRLMQEVAGDARWRGVQVLWGAGREVETTTPFAPLVEALASGLSPLRAEQLSHVVDHLWLAVLSRLVPQLTDWLPSLMPPPPLDDAHEVGRLVEALGQVLAGWSQVTPLVLFLEDLHWLDGDTLAILAQLERRLNRENILIIGDYRGEEARAKPAVWDKLRQLDRAGAGSRLQLTPLDETATAELIRRCLGLAAPAPLFESRLYRETDGNPLFVLETLHVLYDEGFLFQGENGAWSTPFDDTTTDYAELPVPPAVERVIDRRVQPLPPTLRQVLAVAAVLGRRFEFWLLKAVVGGNTLDILAAAGELVRRRFLTEAVKAYDFSHDKVRQVVYGKIPAAERLFYHQRAAEALESHDPDQGETLVSHFMRAECWEKALHYTIQAARRLQASQANQSAMEGYNRALYILDEKLPATGKRVAELRFDVLVARQRLAWITGDSEQQAQDLAALSHLSDVLQVPERQVEVLNQEAIFLCIVRSEYLLSRRKAEAALALAREHDLRSQEATALETLGRTYQISDRFQEAKSHFHQSLAVWETLAGSAAAVVRIRGWLAAVYRHLGHIKQAEAECRESLALAEAENDLLGVTRGYVTLATLAWARSDHLAAVEYNQMALEKSRAIGFRQQESIALGNIGLGYWYLANYQQAISYMRQALAQEQILDSRRNMLNSFNNLASAYRVLGRRPDAHVTIGEGLALAQEVDSPFTEILLYFNLGMLYLDESDEAAAESAFIQVEQLAASVKTPFAKGQASLGWGHLSRVKGDIASAAAYFEQSVAHYLEAGLSVFANEVRSYLAACRLALGQVVEALRLSNQTVTEVEAKPGGSNIQATYLHHWQILEAAGEEKAAQAALEKAYAALQAQLLTLPDEDGWRQDFLEKVTINRQIMAIYNRQPAIMVKAQVETVRLACTDAPTGRPLQDDEWIQVTWHLTLPEDDAIAGKIERRRYRLRRLLQEAVAQGAMPTVEDLARALDAGERTIKRDLAALRQMGEPVLTRGSRLANDTP